MLTTHSLQINASIYRRNCGRRFTKCTLSQKDHREWVRNILNRHAYYTFKYHVSCTDGKISVRINLLLYLFCTVVPSNSCVFLSCKPFIVNMTFSTPTRTVENVILTMKGLQERNTQLLDGTTVEKEGKIIN